ncbi:hypothetical protein ACCO45_013467 [Purpureocillium lilacinum]|uniref:Uncharacterized protein n=1 Tax=Purpureocillium lilacinum TaxID=33203 RepID=A0ACC4D667_PURLI
MLANPCNSSFLESLGICSLRACTVWFMRDPDLAQVTAPSVCLAPVSPQPNQRRTSGAWATTRAGWRAPHSPIAFPACRGENKPHGPLPAATLPANNIPPSVAVGMEYLKTWIAMVSPSGGKTGGYWQSKACHSGGIPVTAPLPRHRRTTWPDPCELRPGGIRDTGARLAWSCHAAACQRHPRGKCLAAWGRGHPVCAWLGVAVFLTYYLSPATAVDREKETLAAAVRSTHGCASHRSTRRVLETRDCGALLAGVGQLQQLQLVSSKPPWQPKPTCASHMVLCSSGDDRLIDQGSRQGILASCALDASPELSMAFDIKCFTKPVFQFAVRE